MTSNLLQSTEEQIKEDVDPADGAKLVRRLRGVNFYLRLDLKLVTERDEEAGTYRSYDIGGNTQVSAREAIKHLDEMAGFNKRKAERGERTGKIPMTRLGHCLFIG